MSDVVEISTSEYFRVYDTWGDFNEDREDVDVLDSAMGLCFVDESYGECFKFTVVDIRKFQQACLKHGIRYTQA